MVKEQSKVELFNQWRLQCCAKLQLVRLSSSRPVHIQPHFTDARTILALRERALEDAYPWDPENIIDGKREPELFILFIRFIGY